MEFQKAFWLNTVNLKKFDSLNKNIIMEVCIVGGGLTGMSTAYYLSKKGYKVVIIEKDNILSKTSGHTTAKITSQQGLFYKYLETTQSEKYARQYLKVNEIAIKNIEENIIAENISCDFERKNAIVFTEKIAELQNIKEEFKTVQKLNVVKSEYIENLDINLKIQGGILFKNQAQFNPVKYAEGLIQAILKNNGQIYEQTSFIEYEKENNEFIIKTNTKYNIKAKYLVLATRYPTINFPGYYFLKMYQEISYVIAIKPKLAVNLSGMYINAEVPTLSIKMAKFGKENIILLAGYTHKTGEEKIEDFYKNLQEKAYEIFGEFELLYKWSTEDCISLDKIPYIGDFSKITNNLLVATGFNKWGMTTSNIAGNIITNKIIGTESEYEELFKATRLEPLKNDEELKNMIKQSIKSLIINKLKSTNEVLQDVQLNEGKIVRFGTEKIGIYKDKKGNIYAVKPICTHLGCELLWNDWDKTWDCPCHGSRFDYTGKSIYSPAIKDLENYNFE